MKRKQHVEVGEPRRSRAATANGDDLLRPLVIGRPVKMLGDHALNGVVIGELVGLSQDGLGPLVRYAGQQGTAALAGRAAVDLQRCHVGKHVVLAFESADPSRPIVLGVVRQEENAAPAIGSSTLDVDVDGERMVVRAKSQLVLVCGSASITLTAAGKVIIRGKYVSSSASGVNRITGGSIELN